jgi:hypothetical protein
MSHKLQNISGKKYIQNFGRHALWTASKEMARYIGMDLRERGYGDGSGSRSFH